MQASQGVRVVAVLYITNSRLKAVKKKGMVQMPNNPYLDEWATPFNAFPDMMNYHAELTRESQWRRMQVNSLYVSPLDENSYLYGDKSRFGVQVSQDAIEDTAKHLALAMKVDGAYFPLRETAWKSLLDRAKINGTALPKLGREELANVLNACLALFSSEALLLIRNEKVSAVHSGDPRDYSITSTRCFWSSRKAWRSASPARTSRAATPTTA